MENTLSFINSEGSGFTYSGLTFTYTYPKEFEFEVRTHDNFHPTAGMTFMFSGSGDFYVDWGDGSSIEQNTNTHTYSLNNTTYTVKIWGSMGSFSHIMNTNYVNAYITKVISWGNLGLESLDIINYSPETNGYILNEIPNEIGRFEDTIPLVGDEYPINLYGSGIKNVPFGFFDNLTTEGYFSEIGTFDGCGLLENIPKYILQKMTNVNGSYSMFNDCISLTTIPNELFGNIISNPTIFSSSNMFSGCINLHEPPVDLFDYLPSTINDLDLAYMFIGCESITYLPIGLFDSLTNKNIDFTCMFDSCEELDNSDNHLLEVFRPLSGQTSITFDFENCFSGCYNLGHAPELWLMFPSSNGNDCFFGLSGSVDNYGSIPLDWK